MHLFLKKSLNTLMIRQILWTEDKLSDKSYVSKFFFWCNYVLKFFFALLNIFKLIAGRSVYVFKPHVNKGIK